MPSSAASGWPWARQRVSARQVVRVGGAALPFGVRRASRYLYVFEHKDEIGHVMSDLPSLNAALRALAGPDATEVEGEIGAAGTEDPDVAPPEVAVVEPLVHGEGLTEGKPAEHEEAPPPVKGQSRVNGVLVDDPPHIAKMRAEGKIPPAVIVEITEPTSEEREAEREAVEAEAEREAKRAAIEAEGQTDEERLAKLPLSSKLIGHCLRQIFHQDALSYWLLQPEVRRFRHNVVQVLNQIERRRLVWSRPYEYALTLAFRVEPPEKWRLCPPPDMGGCGGVGTVPIYGECSKCHGHGYAVR